MVFFIKKIKVSISLSGLMFSKFLLKVTSCGQNKYICQFFPLTQANDKLVTKCIFGLLHFYNFVGVINSKI